MIRRAALLNLLALLLLAGSARSADPPGCYPIPVTEYTPSGLAGCVVYGVGIASTWPGPGAARSDCVWPWTDCTTVSVRSLDTGRAIIVTPSMFGDLYQRVGPNGETRRIIDLAPDQVRALGLDARLGLWPVSVEPAAIPRHRSPFVPVLGGSEQPVLPDTAMAP